MHIRSALVLILAALAPAASGQIIYRSTMPDGRTVLSDKPTPGAVKVQEFYVRPSATSDPGAPAARPAPATAPAADGTSAAKKRDAELDAAIAELRKTEAVLRAAQAARAAAEEPLENERQGIAGGGSRLNDSYFARQKGLDETIEMLRKRVDDAQAKVNSLR